MRVLNVSTCLIDHNDVKMICHAMPKLEVLGLGYSRVNPSTTTLDALMKLKNLKRLQIRGWPIVVPNVNYLLSKLSLEELDVRFCGGVNEKTCREDEFSWSETKVLYSHLGNQSLLESQQKDILEFAKRIQTLPLCRMFFPPLSRAFHRESFIFAFKKTTKLIQMGETKYLVAHQTPVPDCFPTLSNTHLPPSAQEAPDRGGIIGTV
eukprot:TRINITY_DN2206_c0_g1_i1.p1 TRINITY_DN2206_c0_g1~~TRINITY_DN2206_c0_g1_i1.p1  ORF type:complete len:241 (-),score=39.69 TRINITY_DN2206_c0_g1_i1:128-748(-)